MGFCNVVLEKSEEESWTDRVGKEVLRRDKGERNILNTIKRRKGNWVGHISRRKCVVKHVIEGNV